MRRLNLPGVQATHNVMAGVDQKPSAEVALVSPGFVEVWGVNVDPLWRGGLVRVAGHVIDNPDGLGVTYQFATVEVRVLGILGGSVCLARGALANDGDAFEVKIDEPQSYQRVSVLARLVVNGVPGTLMPPVLSPPAGRVTAIGRFVR